MILDRRLPTGGDRRSKIIKTGPEEAAMHYRCFASPGPGGQPGPRPRQSSLPAAVGRSKDAQNWLSGVRTRTCSAQFSRVPNGRYVLFGKRWSFLPLTVRG